MPARKLLNTYGNRAKESSTGLDYKAQYHAYRLAVETQELLLTGKITFPRPEAPLLLDIRNEKLTATEIETLIEAQLEKVEDAVLKSTLKDRVDPNLVEELVTKIYKLEYNF